MWPGMLNLLEQLIEIWSDLENEYYCYISQSIYTFKQKERVKYWMDAKYTRDFETCW
jgi:hypothetical protein